MTKADDLMPTLTRAELLRHRAEPNGSTPEPAATPAGVCAECSASLPEGRSRFCSQPCAARFHGRGDASRKRAARNGATKPATNGNGRAKRTPVPVAASSPTITSGVNPLTPASPDPATPVLVSFVGALLGAGVGAVEVEVGGSLVRAFAVTR